MPLSSRPDISCIPVAGGIARLSESSALVRRRPVLDKRTGRKKKRERGIAKEDPGSPEKEGKKPTDKCMTMDKLHNIPDRRKSPHERVGNH